jgi:hypothetical protein
MVAFILHFTFLALIYSKKTVTGFKWQPWIEVARRVKLDIFLQKSEAYLCVITIFINCEEATRRSTLNIEISDPNVARNSSDSSACSSRTVRHWAPSGFSNWQHEFSTSSFVNYVIINYSTGCEVTLLIFLNKASDVALLWPLTQSRNLEIKLIVGIEEGLEANVAVTLVELPWELSSNWFGKSFQFPPN